MTVDVMINKLAFHLDGRVSGTPELFQSILAALRAGQQMRGQFALPDESKDFPGMIAAIDFFEACKAWDKAVGEGKSE